MIQDDVFMFLALSKAQEYLGATAPNPPVGACITKEGHILGMAAHVRAGESHAEVAAVEQVIHKFGKQALKGSSLYVTLEPCNHIGKTPPCTEAILKSGIEQVVIGCLDPNPHVLGGGAFFLEKQGIHVKQEVLKDQCSALINPFRKWSTQGLPWVVHKRAFRLTLEGVLTMLPEPKEKTFTLESSLQVAHQERKKSDAILISLKTVLVDDPLLNVRFVKDHENKKRFLAVINRAARELPSKWVKRQQMLGFEVFSYVCIESALQDLGKRGVHQVLVEVGPTLSKIIEENQFWDERLTFIHNVDQDFILREYRCSQAL